MSTITDGIIDLKAFLPAKDFETSTRFYQDLGFTLNADDVEVFAGMHSGLSSGRMEWVLLSRGMEEEEERPGGERLGGSMDEVPQRAFYRAWAERTSLGAE